MVTSDASRGLGSENTEWQSIGRVRLEAQGGGWVARVADAQAPASSTHYRVAIAYADRETLGGSSRSMPTAPAFLGRLHDRVAWWPVFRWLPDLR